MPSDYSEILKQITNDKVGKIIFRIIVIILGLNIIWSIGRHVYKDLNGKYSNLFWGMSTVNADPIKIIIHDTVTVNTRDTIKISSNTVKSKPPIKNEQKIDNSGSGIQNNGTNYGIQAGRDINIAAEKQLSDKELIAMGKYVDKLRMDKRIANSQITLLLATGSNGSKVFGQIRQYLSAIGYQVSIGQSFPFPPIQGIEINPSKDEIVIIVGDL